jgi:hypothetical protein
VRSNKCKWVRAEDLEERAVHGRPPPQLDDRERRSAGDRERPRVLDPVEEVAELLLRSLRHLADSVRVEEAEPIVSAADGDHEARVLSAYTARAAWREVFSWAPRYATRDL